MSVNRDPHLDKDTMRGAACEAINYLEAAICADDPRHADPAEVLRCLNEAVTWLERAKSKAKGPST